MVSYMFVNYSLEILRAGSILYCLWKQAVREKLEAIGPQIEEVESERDAVMREASSPDVSGQVQRVVDKLREEWAQVNRCYAERHSRWSTARDVWINLQNESKQFAEWLDSAESVINDWKNSDLPTDVAKMKQKELEKQVCIEWTVNVLN